RLGGPRGDSYGWSLAAERSSAGHLLPPMRPSSLRLTRPGRRAAISRTAGNSGHTRSRTTREGTAGSGTLLPDMKVVVLCGGLGTRLREETEYRPKPLVPIGDRPILWHIMKCYAAFGFTDFILALGSQGEMIKAS